MYFDFLRAIILVMGYLKANDGIFSRLIYIEPQISVGKSCHVMVYLFQRRICASLFLVVHVFANPTVLGVLPGIDPI